MITGLLSYTLPGLSHITRLSAKTHSPPVTPLNSDTEDGTESALTTDIESRR